MAGFEASFVPETELPELGRTIPIPLFPAPDVMELCDRATDLFRSLPMVLEIDGPVQVVGDIHGNFHDLIRILVTYGLSATYLFLGDYVDRGQFSLECILLLFTLTLKFPDRFYLLRGNHEARDIASLYGFKSEILIDYSDCVFDSFCNVFEWIPLAAVIQRRFFCVHGGIGPSTRTIAQIQAIERPVVAGAMSDEVEMLLWADPNSELSWFGEATTRSRGCYYGPSAVRAFLERNKCEYIIRAHECVDGIRASSHMQVITVFSASRYQIGINNRSGVLRIGETGKFVIGLHPPLEKLLRADTLFFTFGRRRVSDSKSEQLMRSQQAFKGTRLMAMRRGVGMTVLNSSRAVLGKMQVCARAIAFGGSDEAELRETSRV
jgi:diadenosine tetraphosphatase ApaH/serine/threonine PP2A family protein phosphatase